MNPRVPLPSAPAPIKPGAPSWNGFGGGVTTVPWGRPAGASALRALKPGRIAIFALACYLFLLGSDLYQILGVYLNAPAPYVSIGFVIIVLLFAFSGGHYLRFAKTPLLAPWLGLLLVWTLASVFGSYPHRSLSYLWEYALRIHSLPFIVCAMALTLRSVRTVMFGAGFGLMAILFFCYKYGQMYYDRYVIPDTSFANGNDLALHILLFGSMFLAFSRAGKFGLLLTLAVLPISVYYTLKTGSRGNLVTMLVLISVSFLVMPAKKKLGVLLASVILGAALVPMLPKQTLDRLQTFFSSSTAGMPEQEPDDYTQNAVDSTMARLNLQRRAIQLTMLHPLFGVGPLNFLDEVDKMVRNTEGHKSGWQVAHNSYLDVSSETGLIGFFFYVWTILACLRLNYKSYRLSVKHPQLKNASILCFCGLLMSITYAVGILFCSIAYDYYLAMVVSMTGAIYLALRHEIQVLESTAAAAAVAAAPPVAAPAAVPLMASRTFLRSGKPGPGGASR